MAWTAKSHEDALPSTRYGEFVLVRQMPAQPGPIYWPVRQVCEDGHADWIEGPQPGQQFSDLKSPAAMLELLSAAGTGGAHMH